MCPQFNKTFQINEILEQIFINIESIEYILRLRRVSKQWKSIIDSIIYFNKFRNTKVIFISTTDNSKLSNYYGYSPDGTGVYIDDSLILLLASWIGIDLNLVDMKRKYYKKLFISKEGDRDEKCISIVDTKLINESDLSPECDVLITIFSIEAKIQDFNKRYVFPVWYYLPFVNLSFPWIELFCESRYSEQLSSIFEIEIGKSSIENEIGIATYIKFENYSISILDMYKIIYILVDSYSSEQQSVLPLSEYTLSLDLNFIYNKLYLHFYLLDP